jgi:hypothetical protein
MIGYNIIIPNFKVMSTISVLSVCYRTSSLDCTGELITTKHFLCNVLLKASNEN